MGGDSLLRIVVAMVQSYKKYSKMSIFNNRKPMGLRQLIEFRSLTWHTDGIWVTPRLQKNGNITHRQLFRENYR